ncbi:MAG: peptidoglycan-binding protein [Acidimicrobiaceae bacterium]|nr:peptidoglycan-binding protein [Acidimicrobiaceae bacterium]MCY4279358.1 peptidoglycan-binding protein [Acidimicrobiaceae bacterium]
MSSGPPQGLLLRRGDSGDDVADLRRRLAVLGYGAGDSQHFDTETEAALRSFQGDRGLVVDGICGRHTWNALVEAAHRLGDRLLYYRVPMMRGDDVADLQRKLGQLGFDPQWVDGVLGPQTNRAIRQFQRNLGLREDGMVGRSSTDALERLTSRTRSRVTIAEVREHERIRRQPTRVEGRRVVLGDTGDLPALTAAIARRLRRRGAEVLSFSSPDLGHQARTANDWNGDIYLGVMLATDNFAVSYFAMSGFESVGGKALAQRCSAALKPYVSVAPKAMRLPILRETRMPAVWCRFGPGELLVPLTPHLSQALAGAVSEWCLDPGLR